MIAQFLVCIAVIGALGFLFLGAYYLFVLVAVQSDLRLRFLKISLLFVYVTPLIFWATQLLVVSHPRMLQYAPAALRNDLSLMETRSLVGAQFSASQLLIFAYLGCVAFLAMRTIISYLWAKRMLADSSLVTIEGNPIYLSANAPGPLCFGMRNTQIFIPPNILDRLNRRELEMIVVHEQTHLKNHDLRWKLLSLVARTFLFFSPAFHVLHRKFELEMEIECDRETRKKTRASLKEYGNVLLSIAVPALNGFTMSTNMSDSTLKRRIVSMKSQTKSRPTLVAVISLIVGLSGASALALTSASVQLTEPQFSDQRVSIQIKDVGVRQAVEEVLTMDGVRFNVAPDVTNSKRVSIMVKKAKISDVFDFLVQEGGLVYSVDGNGVLQVGVQ